MGYNLVFFLESKKALPVEFVLLELLLETLLLLLLETLLLLLPVSVLHFKMKLTEASSAFLHAPKAARQVFFKTFKSD